MSNLIVDLDGSFIETDSSFESFWSAISINPIIIAKSFMWLFKGIPFLKYKLFKASGLNISSLPVNKEVLEIIHEYKKQNKNSLLNYLTVHVQKVYSTRRCRENTVK